MAVEIATAWVQLMPSFKGVQSAITREVAGADVKGPADKAGQNYVKGFGGAISGRSAALAGAIGGLVSSVATKAMSSIGDLVGEAVDASDAVQKFAKTLEFAGIDTTTIDELKKATKAYADETIYDLADIQNVTAQLGANGVKDYDKLAEAAGNLNAVAGGTAETFDSVGLVLTQTAGRGQLTAENWNQLANAIPGASGRLQEAMRNAGAFTGDFREAMRKGEITAEEFNAALLELGSEPVAVEAAKSTETMEGALGNLRATIVGGLADAITSIKPMLTDFISALSGVVQFIIDNINWIGPLAAGIGIAVAAIGVWTAVQWLLNAALTANPIGLVVVAIGLLIGAIILLVQNWDTVVKFLSDVWGGFVSWFTGIMDVFLGWWNNLWTDVWEWVVEVWNGITGFITKVWTTFFLTFQVIGAAISAWWDGLWSGIWDFLAGIWNFIVAGVTAYFNLLFGVIRTVGTAVSDWWNGLWGGIKSFFSGVWDGVLGVFNHAKDIIDGTVKRISDIVNRMKKTFQDVAKGIRDAFDGIGEFIRDAFGAVADFLSGPANALKNFFGGMGDAARHVKGKLKQAAVDPAKQVRGGPALARVKATLPPGLRITDTLSNRARDQALGLVRSVNSYHYDAKNPAVDIAGPVPLLWDYARKLQAMGGWRQFLWQVPGHYDHIHVAHSGGTVLSSWPRMPGDSVDERTVRLQVGETVLPRDWTGEVDVPAARSMPSTLVVVDEDGQLIGRMRVEARGEVGRFSTARDAESARGYRGGF